MNRFAEAYNHKVLNCLRLHLLGVKIYFFDAIIQVHELELPVCLQLKCYFQVVQNYLKKKVQPMPHLLSKNFDNQPENQWVTISVQND